MLCDYHVHSYYSDDSDYPMEDIVKDAIYRGFEEICFTDHVDYGIKIDPMGKSQAELEGRVLNVNFPLYFQEIEKLSQQYQGKIVLKKGLEFGVQQHTIPLFEKLFSEYDLDFVILSCHQVDDQEFWSQDFQFGKTQKQYNERYYQEILAVIKKYKNYSVLGHLDLINRYDKHGIYPFEKVSDIIEEILKQVITDGKGIEVNTSASQYGMSGFTPSQDVLKLYKKLGGKIVTIGSDSHDPERLGASIEAVKKELKELGFQYYCTFDAMKPQYHIL